MRALVYEPQEAPNPQGLDMDKPRRSRTNNPTCRAKFATLELHPELFEATSAIANRYEISWVALVRYLLAREARLSGAQFTARGFPLTELQGVEHEAGEQRGRIVQLCALRASAEGALADAYRTAQVANAQIGSALDQIRALLPGLANATLAGLAEIAPRAGAALVALTEGHAAHVDATRRIHDLYRQMQEVTRSIGNAEREYAASIRRRYDIIGADLLLPQQRRRPREAQLSA